MFIPMFIPVVFIPKVIDLWLWLFRLLFMPPVLNGAQAFMIGRHFVRSSMCLMLFGPSQDWLFVPFIGRVAAPCDSIIDKFSLLNLDSDSMVANDSALDTESNMSVLNMEDTGEKQALFCIEPMLLLLLLPNNRFCCCFSFWSWMYRSNGSVDRRSCSGKFEFVFVLLLLFGTDDLDAWFKNFFASSSCCSRNRGSIGADD